MRELDKTTAHSIILTKFCKPSHALTKQEFLLEADFPYSTLKFNGFELNLNVFCTLLSDMYS